MLHIVDDEEVIRDSLAWLAHSRDIPASTYDSGKAFLAALDSIGNSCANGHCLLLDVRMPGMDGLTAIRHIRARGDAKAKLPIIVVTADTALDLREQCLEAGANDVLFKPVAMDALFEAMGRVLAEGDGGVIG